MKLSHLLLFALASGVFLFLAPSARGQYNVTPLNVPGAVGTMPNGFADGSIFGHWFKDTGNVNGTGFLYNGSSFSPLNTPPGLSAPYVSGISGGVEVGGYHDNNGTHGFIYDGLTVTTLDDPLANNVTGSGTFANAISGNTVVGNYATDASHLHGFIYNGSGYTTLDVPHLRLP